MFVKSMVLGNTNLGKTVCFTLKFYELDFEIDTVVFYTKDRKAFRFYLEVS